jgi:tetratricopeptide (TPR) repeat protein
MIPSLSVCILVPEHCVGLAGTLKSCQTVAQDFLLLHSGPAEKLARLTADYPVRTYPVPAENRSGRLRELLREQTSAEWLLWLISGEKLAPATALKLPALLWSEQAGFFFRLLSGPFVQSERNDPGLEIKKISPRLFRRHPELFGSGAASDLTGENSPYSIFNGLEIEQTTPEAVASHSETPFGPDVLGIPAQAWTKYREGIYAYQQAHYETARACFTEARCSINAATSLAPLFTANIILTYLAQRQWPSAREELQAALELFPDEQFFRYLEGVCCFNQFDFRSAKNSWKICLSREETLLKQPDNSLFRGEPLFALALYRLGQIAYLQNDGKQAGKYWLQALAVYPENPAPLAFWLRLQREAGCKPAEALRMLQNCLPGPPPTVALKWLQIMKTQFEPTLLLNEVETVADQMPSELASDLQAVWLKTECLLKLKKFRTLEAFLAFETNLLLSKAASGKRPLSPEEQGQLTKLLIYRCLGRWGQSPPQTAAELVRKMPVAPGVRQNLAGFNRYLTAAATPPEVVRSVRPTLKILKKIVKTAAVVGFADCIVKVYTFMAQIAPPPKKNQLTTALALGKDLFQAGDDERALLHLRQAQEENQSDAAGLVFLAQIYRRQRLFAEAQSCYEASLKLLPSRQTYLELTCCYQEEIIFYADRGLALTPGAVDLRKERKEAWQCRNFFQRLLAVSD